jgi:hypothetical protein
VIFLTGGLFFTRHTGLQAFGDQIPLKRVQPHYGQKEDTICETCADRQHISLFASNGSEHRVDSRIVLGDVVHREASLRGDEPLSFMRKWNATMMSRGPKASMRRCGKSNAYFVPGSTS